MFSIAEIGCQQHAFFEVLQMSQAAPAATAFQVGNTYTRNDVFEVLGIGPQYRKGGNWFNGYNSHKGDWFIFCAVGAAGRTGHDYDNYWAGDELVWRGKTGSRLSQPSIRSLIQPSGKVHVFTRENNLAPFTY